MNILHGVARAVLGTSLAVLAYTWVGYPLLLKLLLLRKPLSELTPPPQWPMVSAITTVYNEEEVIGRKLENLLSMEYPKDCLQILIVSDGSEDGTDDVVRQYAGRGVDLYVRPVRGGVTVAFNDAVSRSRGDVILHSDADTRHEPDFLLKLMPHYADPLVGVAEGEFRFLNTEASGLAQNQGLYWRFEMFLRRAESRLGVLSTVSGAIMSFRKDVFEPFQPSHSVDGTLPKLAIRKGYRVVHEPSALAYDEMVRTVQGELRARVRMTSRNLAGWGGKHAFPHPLRHPGTFTALVSHKILRWLTPIFMILALCSNLPLFRGRIARFLLGGQILFYASAVTGYLLELRNVRLRIFSAPFSFCLANLGFLLGWWKTLRQQRVVIYRSEQ
ncbi:MAG: glycosyltransferase [Chloroflexia bacterium]|nr:glycosyltransferase [Chloroflexia bacterium]